MTLFEFSDDENTILYKLYNSVKSNDQISISFDDSNNIGIINCIRFYKEQVNSSYKRENCLYIDYNDTNNSIYRITINELDNINTYINFFKNNTNDIIMNSISTDSSDKDPIFENIIYSNNTILLPDFNLTGHSYTVNMLDNQGKYKIQNLKGNDKYEISFKLNDIISFEIYKDSNCTINVVIRSTTKSNFIKKVVSDESKYSINININIHSKLNHLKHGKIIANNIFNILQILNRTNIVIRNVYKNEVLLKYSQLMFKKNIINKIFASRKPISVDVRAIIYDIPNQYSVTDKADGERHLLFVYNKNVILLSSNLEVKHSGIILNNSNFDNTVIDGELILNQNLQLYMSFDILFIKGTDLRHKYNLSQRLNYLYSFMKDCFNINIDHVNTKTSNVNDLIGLYNTDIDKYLFNFNKKIQLSNKFIIWYKYYILPRGIQTNEIYIYTNLLWTKFTNKQSNLPYKLDGIIYTPINQDYKTPTNDQSNKNIHEYKLKPLSHLTIDFYIEFDKNPKTHQITTIFDKTQGDIEFYKCNLFVNDTSNHAKHIPIPFRKEANGHFTYIPIIDNMVKDKAGTIITDKTVVEFSYNPNLSDNFRWVPIKCRLDKTDTLKLYKKNYGNNKLTADYIWEIISNPITFDDIAILATEKYNTYSQKLKETIQTKLIDTYYQHKTGLVLPMRAFHNSIKSSILSIYCKPYFKNKQIIQKTVLDIGVGRGGDLSKYYIAGVKKIVGVDLDDSSFYIPNGTLDKFKKVTNPRNILLPIINLDKLETKMEGVFIKANAGHELTVVTQSKVLDNNTSKNKELITKHLQSQKFDVISCQFTIHYMFKSESNVQSFFNNVNNLLNKDGYLLVTCFDGNLVNNILNKNNGVFNISYSDQKGQSVSLFNIEKLYKDDEFDKSFNLPINVMNNLYSSTGKVEYLVLKDVLIEYATKFGNLQLLETDTFYNLYELNRPITEYIKSNNNFNDKIKGMINNMYNLYHFENDIDQASLEFSKLNRYYVFTKK